MILLIWIYAIVFQFVAGSCWYTLLTWNRSEDSLVASQSIIQQGVKIVAILAIGLVLQIGTITLVYHRIKNRRVNSLWPFAASIACIIMFLIPAVFNCYYGGISAVLSIERYLWVPQAIGVVGVCLFKVKH